jgi:DNA adenine methylase
MQSFNSNYDIYADLRTISGLDLQEARNYAYSGMFRYNSGGGFNVPYGGIGYNRKNLAKKVDYLQSKELVEHLSKTTIDNLDFEEFFMKNKPKKDDFIFLDPPYDSEFSTYAQNEFTRDDQARLADYLINHCEANWMMVIKNTEFIYGLYNKPNINMSSFDKKYLVSFQNRNDKDAEHLIITNYKA